MLEAAERMLALPDMHSRRIWYRRFMDRLADYLDTHRRVPGAAGHHGSLERLEALERLEGLEGKVDAVTALRLDYRKVPVPAGAVVYADPPYRGSREDYGSGFDFHAFDDWLAAVDFPVIVSETQAPAGTVPVAERAVRSIIAATDNTTRRTEKLFIQQRFKDWYEQMVGNID